MDILSRKEELILLMIWKLGDNAYGLNIVDELSSVTGIKWLFGSIYTPLGKLYDKGLITRYERTAQSDSSGRPRVYFRLTGNGKKALAEIKEFSNALWADMPPITF